MLQFFRYRLRQYWTVWLLAKRPVKEQITICTDRQAAITALAANRTKSLLVAHYTKKLALLSEENQVTIMWTLGHCGNELNETVDRPAREGTRTRPISPESFIPLSLSKYKSKIRNCTEKRKETEWKVYEKYATSQLCLKRSTNMYVWFISELDRKHCKMLIGILTRTVSENSFMRKIRCWKRNIDAHFVVNTQNWKVLGYRPWTMLGCIRIR